MSEDILESLLTNMQMAQVAVMVHKDTLTADSDGEADVHQLDAALVFIETAIDELLELLELLEP